jgi:hypothetical protein
MAEDAIGCVVSFSELDLTSLDSAAGLIGPQPSSPSQPRAHQHQVGRACGQQCDGERDVHALAGGFEGRSHDGENIGLFYPGSLGDYFSNDS